ncbi:glycosyl hydrolase 2 galactose-binding domain-containing protein [Cohnella zeiphila]|uniref:glycosyl hydrolase 2 galactose-binding domain-containing protein n=1 Tax=Cohnella zeiphila TaxID=2761120 RepID=UPI001EE340F5|nr:sugar-binding domain-containing protein [Cohnella zeiphila]
MNEREGKAADPFAEIALREHPIAKEGLVASATPAFGKRLLAPGSAAAVQPEEPDYETQLGRFRQELERLREAYRPYLRQLSPAKEPVRRRLDIREFDFRYRAEADRNFAGVLAGEGEWERVTVPDFRGPTKERGRWTGYYRTRFRWPRPAEGRRVYLVFKGVDYHAAVYVNGRCAGSHEGFFAPFEFDVTEALQQDNALVVEVRNDYPMMGVAGTRLDGDKMYAATGPGWDEPVHGWHHCPPGAGIYNDVYVEERAELFADDVFVRPQPEAGGFEAWIDAVNAADGLIENAELRLDVYADNFEGPGLADIRFPIAYAGPGMNNYRYRIEFPGFRLWEPDRPHLYRLRARLFAPDGRQLDAKDRVFGMRSFRMDEESEPKGGLILNGRPIVLRGANEMGHLQQCVMKGDDAQLIDDILIAKLANLNFYRLTQRPVQEKIYDFLDRLGMLNQCDLPAFGYVRRSRFAEAVRQTAEMERLVRGHPSVVLVSLINEPSRPAKRNKGHRHLFRDELEAFFAAARKAIYIENPDRVVKNADGDYDPPTAEGMSDFHCYTMWYTNHMIPFGRLYEGELPPLKAGWKTGCGEYGSEGLDRLELMRDRYPREWLPASDDEEWMPNAIADSQTYALHGDWYPERNRIRDWIEASQQYQALVTKRMTDALRLRADLVVQSAVHLLIDAWPSGWMKALVGVDRVPKPAYFAYREALEPLRVYLRGDRWTAYSGERIMVEVWLLNDRPDGFRGGKVLVTLRDETADYGSWAAEGEVGGTSSAYIGTAVLELPPVSDRKTLFADANLLDEAGRLVHAERFRVEAFARDRKEAIVPTEAVVGKEAARGAPVQGDAGMREAAARVVYLGESARRAVEALGLAGTPLTPGDRFAERAAVLGTTAAALGRLVPVDRFADWDAIVEPSAEAHRRSVPEDGSGERDAIVVSSAAAFRRCELLVRERVEAGACVIFLQEEDGGEAWAFGGATMRPEPAKGLFFLARNAADSRLRDTAETDFSFFYNRLEDRIDPLAGVGWSADGAELAPLLYTYAKPAHGGEPRPVGKRQLPVVASLPYGRGEALFVGLLLDGRLGCNPALDRLMRALIFSGVEA